VKPTQLGPIDRASPYLRTPVPAPGQDGDLDKDRTMDNVQEHNICTYVPSSQNLDLNSSSVSHVFIAALKILTSHCLATIRGYTYRHTGAMILSRIRGSVTNTCGF
jgi:hypothetical protein